MLEFSVCIAIAIVAVFVWLTWNYNYWKKQDIPYIEPSLVFGNIKDFVLMKKCKGLIYHDLYRQSSAPAVGIFTMRQPQLLIRDPALVKILTINEFNNFKENDFYVEESDFFLTTNIFFYSGEKWKKNRSIITPSLSMAKLKQFIPHMLEVCREMITFLDENTGKAMEAKHFCVSYTTDTSNSYVYGVKCDSFKDPHSNYRKAFLEVFNPNWWRATKFLIACTFPSIGHFFKIGFTPSSFVDFYTSVVKETVDYRRKNNFSRKDFLQFLMDSSGKDGVPELSIYDMTGLSMNLVADSTETTSSALALIMDALIRYPEEQRKVREEIDSIIEDIDSITYENLNSLSYLQAFISESMRILTPIPFLEKRCTNNCDVSFDGKIYRFKKGDRIALPLYSIHNDEKYFPNPAKFNPGRFIDSEPTVFSPFGYGPRACIGKTFATLQIKLFLVSLLKHFEVLPKGNVVHDVEIDIHATLILAIKGGVWFKVKRR